MIEQIISRRLQIPLHQVQGTVCLLREGATIPFISRYRKEATGSLDEVQVASVKEWLDRLTELETRKQTVLTTIEGQGRLTPELRRRIAECWDAVELEDIYLPYKPKRRTRATVARERGLEPLAEIILAQQSRNVVQQARRFVSAEVPTPEEALAGACDIVAERISEDERARNTLRRTFAREGIVHSKLVKGKETEGAKYADYFDAETPLRSISSHRFLAMRRGEEEGILKIAVDVDAEHCIESLRRLFVRPGSATREWMEAAVADAFKRLIRPSIETEQLAAAKEKADDEAIRVFAENLRQLLLSSPLGQKRVVAIDPGFRTGCKVVALDAQGNLLHNTTVYPHPPQGRAAEAAETLKSLAARHKAEAFAIGDGTAGRETEQLVRGLGLDGVEVFMVSEDGASVYSASAAAREEFPDYDVTVRGAVSIGRRLIDPLSELVKIDPKSIGVGQYQHSVDPAKLKARLRTVVESCVNRVGVNINTASKHILTYISGLGPVLAQNIVAYRAANGEFKSRRALLKVPRLGAKAFEQAAGFLRVVGGANPLDNSAVHPESYAVVERMAADAGVTVERLLHNTTVYPHPPQGRAAEAAETLKSLAARHKAEAFAIGDGTAGRETEQLVRGLGLDGVEVFMVSEDGASVYSASAAAREEFPDYDVTVRGAVSIGRRLIDPLSELVKIDPKSIGVGQYQHSVDPAKLKARLRTVVESCVNRVGVNINTASKHILTYISGLGPVLAQNIVAYRAANGEFKSRRALLKVPRLGAKAFEQAAGFLRVVGGANPLDNSAVHPESYAVVERMAADAGVTVERLLADKQLRSGLKAERYVSGETGLPTVTDILEALDKRGLDPREQLQVFAFDPNVHTIGDLREGMLLPGIVTNITAFGAFVDIGVKQDGLVHISQLADRYVASPADVVHLGQHVEVRVTGVDAVRGRIALSMRREA